MKEGGASGRLIIDKAPRWAGIRKPFHHGACDIICPQSLGNLATTRGRGHAETQTVEAHRVTGSTNGVGTAQAHRAWRGQADIRASVERDGAATASSASGRGVNVGPITQEDVTI